LSPHFGRGVGGVAGASRTSGDRGDVDQVAAALAELVEEDLGRGHSAEQVDLDHLALLGALVGGERPEQHHAGVVDEHVDAPELILAAWRRRRRVAVGDVCLDGQCSVAELVGDRLDAVGAAGHQDDAVAVGGQCARSPHRCPMRRPALAPALVMRDVVDRGLRF
jgi:hypothetical protein